MGAGEDRLGEELSAKITADVERSVREAFLGPSLPVGTVTIVFTDVAGSTELVRDMGDRAAHALLRAHDRVVDEVARDHDGVNVERAGDSFMLAFRSARRAAEFALALHDRLAAEDTDRPVRVRIGIDTGEVIAEERGYFGTTVFRASRIADLAAPGQTIASEATKVLVARPEAGAEFADLGERQLKGLDGTHRLYEVTRPAPAQNR
jgi:class 3 adenylate cyclase